VLALATRCTGPDVGRHTRRFLVEGKDDAVGDERLEGLELPLKRLPIANRKAISSQAFEYRYRGYRQASEASQIRECTLPDDRVAAAQGGQQSVLDVR